MQQKVEASSSELQQKVEGARTELQQQLADTSTRLTTEGAARERSVGLSLAANSLDTALQTGQPFAADGRHLAPARARAIRSWTASANTLEPMAAAGIPTVASLAQKLDEIEQGLAATPGRTALRLAGRGPRENLNNLVDLHPADEEAVPGAERGARRAPGPAAAGSAGCRRGAASRWPSRATRPPQAWIASANQRLAAVGAVDTLRQQLKTMLARQG